MAYIYVLFTDFIIYADSFFFKYNYKTFIFHIYDNKVPSAVLPVVDFIVDAFYFIAAFIVYPVEVAYTLYTEFFYLLENTITHATNFLVAKAVSIALKFLACICLLIFARGGIPRFRFDYLTRLG